MQEAAIAEANGAMETMNGLGLTDQARETIRAMAEFFITRGK